MLDCEEHRDARISLKGALKMEHLSLSVENILFPPKIAATAVFRALAAYIMDCGMTSKI